MRVIDYAWGRPGIAALKAAGAVAVCRYLSWLPNGKCLSKDEADSLRAGGIDIVSNWEYYGDWVHDYSGGYAKGVEHAREAQRQHLACGGLPSRPIYFSTDFNPTPSQLQTIADYYRGVAAVIGLELTGAYGGYATIKYLFDRGVIRWGWQTYAWSTFRDVPEGPAYLHWDDRAQLRQVRNGVLIGGVDSDLNDTMTADFGQWGGAADMSAEAEQNIRDIKSIALAMMQGLDGAIGLPNATLAWEKNRYGREMALKAGVEGLTAQVGTLGGALKTVLDAGGNAETAAVMTRLDEHAAAAEAAARQRYEDERVADEQRHTEMVAALQREHDAQVAALKAQLAELTGPQAVAEPS